MNYSELESKRFGLHIFRGEVQDQINPKLIQYIIEQNQVDVLIFRVNAHDQHQLYKIQELGYQMLVADTLVYYECALKQRPKTPPRNTDLRFEFAQKSDKNILQKLTDDIFEDYTNHYFSNPNFDKQAITEGYKEWAISHLSENPNPEKDDKLLWIIKQNTENVGFTACKIEKLHSYDFGIYIYHTFNGILNGIASRARRSGIYADMIGFMCDYFENRGFEKMRISTQIQNYAVQKVWNRNHFFLTNAYITVHINSMLGQKLKTQKRT